MLPLHMHWRDLLFAHWPVSPALLRATLPPGLELDLLEGEAWVSVVPFDMSGVGLPGFDFAELNVRTYVVCDGRPGVWFYSLDAASKLAVRAARRFFHLNYCDASMSVTRDGEAFEYRSRRTHRGMVPASLDVRYRPVGPAALSVPGSLDYWLTERYCLYSFDGRQLYRGEVRHEPWQLQPAEAEWRVLDMTQGLGFELAGPPRRLAFARHVAVRAGWIEPLPPTPIPVEARLVVERIALSLPSLSVKLEEFPSGSFMIDLPIGDEVWVIEYSVRQPCFGLSRMSTAGYGFEGYEEIYDEIETLLARLKRLAAANDKLRADGERS